MHLLLLQNETTVSTGETFVVVGVATFDERLEWRDMLLHWFLQKEYPVSSGETFVALLVAFIRTSRVARFVV